MSRNESADTFVDCVVRRTQWDTVMKPGIVVATMIVPAVLALAIYAIEFSGSDVPSNGVLAGVITAFAVEGCLIGFMINSLASRTSSHLERDMIWTSSLVGYARSKGADVTHLQELADDMHRRIRKPVKYLSLVLWGFSVLYLMALVFYFAGHDGDDFGDIVYQLITISYILLLVQFLLTTGSTYGFPYSHERSQVRFTEEFSARMHEVGIDVEPMRPQVGRTYWPICIVLFVITLGLFSIVMFLLSCRNMAVHLRNQSAYEEELMGRIIRIEGGSGVRPVEGSGPGKLKSFVKSIF